MLPPDAYADLDPGALVEHSELEGAATCALPGCRNNSQRSARRPRPGAASDLVYCHTEKVWLCPGRCHRKWHFRQYKREIERMVGVVKAEDNAYSSRQKSRRGDQSSAYSTGASAKRAMDEMTAHDKPYASPAQASLNVEVNLVPPTPARTSDSDAEVVLKQPRPNMAQGNIRQPAALNLSKHIVLDVFELRYLAELERRGEGLNPPRAGDDDNGMKRSAKWQYCQEHTQNRLQLYCATCDRYMCTKCLLRERDAHMDHDIHETKELYVRARADLERYKSDNERLREKFVA